MIAYLGGVADILSPGGRYLLIVPDRRYCFDHHTPNTTIEDLVTAHEEQRRVHTEKSIRQHWLELTHNDALRHWVGLHGRPGSFNFSPERADEDIRRSADGAYVDVHAWRFTPATFWSVFDQLHERGLTRLRPTRVHDTMFGQMEFFAVLEAR